MRCDCRADRILCHGDLMDQYRRGEGRFVPRYIGRLQPHPIMRLHEGTIPDFNQDVLENKVANLIEHSLWETTEEDIFPLFNRLDMPSGCFELQRIDTVLSI